MVLSHCFTGIGGNRTMGCDGIRMRHVAIGSSGKPLPLGLSDMQVHRERAAYDVGL